MHDYSSIGWLPGAALLNFWDADSAPIPFEHATDGPGQTSGHLDFSQAAPAAVVEPALPTVVPSSDSDSHVLEAASVYVIVSSAMLPHANMFYAMLTLLLTILSPLIRLT